MDIVTYGALQKKIKEADGGNIPTAVSAFENDAGYQTEQQVNAKLALKQDKLAQYVSSVNGETDAVSVTPETIGAEKTGTAERLLGTHNTEQTAHNDIRVLLQELSERVNAVLDSDDTTLDQMSELVAYIKSNKNLIDAVTTEKISYSDIVDNLTTNVGNKPLSAAQGVALKALIDAIIIPTKLSQLTNDTGYQSAGQVGAAIEAARENYSFGLNVSLSAGGMAISLPSGITYADVVAQYEAGKHVVAVIDIPSAAGDIAGLYLFPLVLKHPSGQLVFSANVGKHVISAFINPNGTIVYNDDLKTNVISSASTNDEYPSAKAVYDHVGGLSFRKAYAAIPASPAEGDVYYNTEAKTVQTYKNGMWSTAVAADENTVYFVVEG